MYTHFLASPVFTWTRTWVSVVVFRSQKGSTSERSLGNTGLTTCMEQNSWQITVPQIVMKFQAFYWNRKFSTIINAACHLPLFWARWIQSMSPPHCIPLRSMYYYFSIYPWSSNFPFPVRLTTEVRYLFLLSLIRVLCLAELILFDTIIVRRFSEHCVSSGSSTVFQLPAILS